MTALVDVFAQVDGLGLPDAAAALTGAGLPVFPCQAGGKAPLTRRGFHDATTDPAQIQKWWARWPQANIGMPTGAVSGLVVVDVDRRTVGAGFAAWRRAVDAGVLVGWLALVRTPSGGIHAYYPTIGSATPGQVAGSWSAGRAHVDLRGEGGYVITPPSRIPGVAKFGGKGTYGLVVDCPNLPARVHATGLRNLIDPPPPATVPAAGASGPGPGWCDSQVQGRQLAAWVSRRVEGERNQGVFWAACRLAHTGITQQEAVMTLAPAAEQTGLPAREVLSTIASAYRRTQPADALGEAARGQLKPIAEVGLS